MNSARARHPGRTALACALAALLGTSVAWAAPASKSEVEARYQQERTQCLSGQSHQDRRTCLQEAAAARGEALKGRLDDGQAARYEQNAMLRCNALPVDDRDECQARIRGEGTTSGSVEAGGIYRELVTVEPAPQTQMAPAAPATGQPAPEPMPQQPMTPPATTPPTR